MSDLYAASLAVRYAASARLGTTQIMDEYWPGGGGGAANAFLVAVGPSPGGESATADNVRYGLTGKPKRLGPAAMNYDWPGKDGRRSGAGTKWQAFASGILGSDAHARALMALLNLVPMYAPDGSTVPTAGFDTSFRVVIWPAILTTQPRLVCAVTNAVWETMATTLTPHALQCAANPYAAVAFAQRRQMLVGVPEVPWPICVFQSVRHPNYLSGAHRTALGDACQWFLSRS